MQMSVCLVNPSPTHGAFVILYIGLLYIDVAGNLVVTSVFVAHWAAVVM